MQKSNIFVCIQFIYNQILFYLVKINNKKKGTKSKIINIYCILIVSQINFAYSYSMKLLKVYFLSRGFLFIYFFVYIYYIYTY